MILLRHGQTVFNLHFGARRVDPGVPDPPLTELGRSQAAAAAEALRSHGVSRIVASPYSRAIETAVIVGRRLELDVEIDADIRERAGFSCDIGSEPSELRENWPDLSFDHLSEGWWFHPHGDPANQGLDEPETSLDDRVGRFASRTVARPDWRETLVVCHWGPIRSLYGMTVGNGEFVRWRPSEEAHA